MFCNNGFSDYCNLNGHFIYEKKSFAISHSKPTQHIQKAKLCVQLQLQLHLHLFI